MMGKVYGCIQRIAVVLLISVVSLALGGEDISIGGKVADVDGAAIAGAKVTLFNLEYNLEILNYEIASDESVESDEKGAYAFSVKESSERRTSKMIIARKEGLAIGWANWYSSRDVPSDITLGPAGKIGGTVVDESGNPIAGAEVRVMAAVEKSDRSKYIISINKSGFLITQTDEQGGFEFDELPENVLVMFQVSKAGKGAVITYDPEASGINVYIHSVGQRDIKIVLAEESVIEGRVIDKASGKPVEGIRLRAVMQRKQYTGREAISSKADGSFRICELGAGEYTLGAVFKDAELAPWIAGGVKVDLASGEHKKDVEIALEKGGVLEITVTEQDSGAVVEGAYVNIQRKEPQEYFGLYSNEQGKVQKRLLPGEYKLQRSHKTGMTSEGQQDFAIEDGKTTSLSISMEGLPKVTGVVLDPDGKPLGGVAVVVKPAGRQRAKSDAEGRYEATWNPRSWSSGDTTYCLVAMHEEKNLAFSEIMDGGSETIAVKMEPGWFVSGTVVDPDGKAIKGANIMPMLRISSWGSSLGTSGKHKTDGEGKFTIQALPPDRDYDIYARCEGYGKKRINIKADQFEEGRLDVGEISISLANLSICGKVVDSEGEPVKGATIYGYEEGQPDIQNITTDAEGKFVIKGVCEGRIRLSAQSRNGSNMRGSVQTEGGAEDVTIVIGERNSSGRFVPRQAASLKGKALGELADLGLETKGGALEGKGVVLCFWDMNQRPSRYFVKQLAGLAESLGQRVSVLLVETSSSGKEKVDEWMKKYDVSYRCGILEKDFSKVKFDWGVKGLPWLILTDKEHVVSSEGISLKQLDDEIKKVSN